MLVDTGASCSILSKQIFDSLPKEKQRELRPADVKVAQASGESMKIHGEIDIDFSLLGDSPKKKFNFQLTMLVGDLGGQGILGLDFLEDQDIALHLQRGCLSVGKEEVKMFKESAFQCNHLRLTKDITIL